MLRFLTWLFAPARTNACPRVVIVSGALLVIALPGCPGGNSDRPTPQVVAPASDDSVEPSGIDGAQPPAEPLEDGTSSDAKPLDDEARAAFIAQMREMGVSVEQNADDEIISLVMGFTKIDDDGLAKLPPLPKLEFIGLDHTEITDKGLEAIADRTSLKILQLGGNEISAAGVKHLSGLKNLEYVDLSDLPIGDEALAPLANLKSLRELNLTATEVTLEGAIAFAKALPDLEVSAPFGKLIGGRRLTMDPGVEDADLAKLKSLDSLRELNLWECDNITDVGIEHIVALDQLTTLELGYTKVTDEGLAQLAALENLEQLDIRDTQTSIAAALKLVADLTELHVLADWGTVDGAKRLHFNPDATDEHLANLQHLPALKSLNLWRCDKLTDDAMAQVAKCEDLRELNLGATNIGDEGLASLKDASTIERLVLANTPLSDAGAVSLSELKNLKSLDLSSTGLTDGGIEKLTGLDIIESLNLARTAVTDDGIGHLAGMKELRSLDLQETTVTGEFMATVAGELANLQSLDLSLTLIDDAALTEIGNFKSLKSLDLWGTRITDEGIKHLHGTSLTHLGLFGAPVSEEAVAVLEEALPELDIVYGIHTDK